MFVHIAIFKWKKGTSNTAVQEALQLVRDVKDRVEGIESILCGENYSKWNQGFTHGVVVTAVSQEAMDMYRADEVHEHAAKLIDAMEEDGIGFDFQDP